MDGVQAVTMPAIAASERNLICISPVPINSVRATIVAAEKPHHSDRLAVPLAHGHGGATRYGLSRGNVAHDAAFPGNPRMRANAEMVAHRGLTADHHAVTDRRAAGDANLACQRAAGADMNIVGDLHQIIDRGAGADDGVAKSA